MYLEYVIYKTKNCVLEARLTFRGEVEEKRRRDIGTMRCRPYLHYLTNVF